MDSLCLNAQALELLYMAIELDNNRWKWGFTVGFRQGTSGRDKKSGAGLLGVVYYNLYI